ncbi:MAG: hypothetical protein HFJ42_00955 [Clostridia bacterium]|nr:hypothetical protein [Clostridia bacterium]
MNKILDKLSIIIVIVIIVMSITTISRNSIKVLQGKYYLKVDSNNRDYIEKTVSENYKLSGTLDKVAYMQELGDWSLFLYYKDGTEDKALFGDGNNKVEHLREYIRENGYNEGEVSWNKIKVSFWTIVVVSICESIYLMVRMIAKRK